MKLNEIMEFDHVIRVNGAGAISAVPEIYAPSSLDGEIDSDKWEFFTTGYSGQDRYNGPWMHNSEYIGGRLEDDILATPGVYVSIVGYYLPEDDSEELDVEGWAILKLKEIQNA